MNLTKVDKLMICLGGLFGIYVCYALVMMNDHAVLGWNIAYGFLFVALALCVWGLWRTKLWAYYLSLLLATAGLGLGIYFLHFAWTFWIFKEPTFFERLLAVSRPQIIIFTLMPVAWLRYFLNAGVRPRFRG